MVFEGVLPIIGHEVKVHNDTPVWGAKGKRNILSGYGIITIPQGSC
jgi:hypothetical protein